MNKPKLTDFTDFIEKPKPVIPKSHKEIKNEINLYLNIALILIIIIGAGVLYYRHKYKEQTNELTKIKLQNLDDYMDDYIIQDMIHKNMIHK
jgi:hypothetical protein